MTISVQLNLLKHVTSFSMTPGPYMYKSHAFLLFSSMFMYPVTS